VNGTPDTSILILLAEVAAAFIGFSTVYFALRRRHVDRQRLMFLRDVAGIGLACLFGSLLPLFVLKFVSEPLVGWRICAALLALVWTLGWVSTAIEYRRSGFSSSITGTLLSPDTLINIGGLALLYGAAIAPGPRAGTIYAAAMALLLALSGGHYVAGVFASGDGD
jgi:hypothetical protein